MKIQIHRRRNGYEVGIYRTFFVKKDKHYVIWRVTEQYIPSTGALHRKTVDLVKILDQEGTDQQVMLLCLKDVKRKALIGLERREEFAVVEDKESSNAFAITSLTDVG
ncbi:MAG: hypothetical protein WC697_02670 [Patescibacteria group bacterium]|jgi:hypothetical protein